jgi:hypothetical protein
MGRLIRLSLAATLVGALGLAPSAGRITIHIHID